MPAADEERLKPLLGRSFADAATVAAAVATTLGPSAHTAAIVRAADQGARRCQVHFGWLTQYGDVLRTEYLPLVEMTYSAEK